jgi:hypothetical protein
VRLDEDRPCIMVTGMSHKTLRNTYPLLFFHPYVASHQRGCVFLQKNTNPGNVPLLDFQIMLLIGVYPEFLFYLEK